MKIKKGDLVKVLSGAAGKSGVVARVLAVFPKDGRVQVEGVASIRRHVKPQRNPKHPEGGLIDGLGTIHISNVMLMSESLNRPVRTGKVRMDDGEMRRCVRGRNLKAEII